MAGTAARRKRLKTAAGIILLLTVGAVLFCIVCRNTVFILMNRRELDIVLKSINSENRVRFSRIGQGEEKSISVSEGEADDELLDAVGELFKRKRITYIGWGVPVSGNNWEQVYIGIRSDAERSEYLVYCGDESELPDYSRNRKAKVSWVIGDWYRIVFYGKDPTMGG